MANSVRSKSFFFKMPHWAVYMCVAFFIFVLLFRSLLFHFTTHLIDGIDYPLYSWIIWSVQDLILHGGSSGNLYGNAFYPHQNVLLFSDLLLVPVILSLPVRIATQSVLIVTNIAFTATFVLNALASWRLTQSLKFDRWASYFAGISVVFSSYIFSQIAHIQMLQIWPVLFGLSLLFQGLTRRSAILLSGLFISCWYTAVYMGTLFSVCIGLFVVSQLLSGELTRKIFNELFLFCLLSAIPLALLLWAYSGVQTDYQVIRDPGMFVDYSAQISDYIFWNTSSVVAQIPGVSQFVGMNRHHFGEPYYSPGIVIYLLATIGLMTLRRANFRIFAISLLLTGFICSLGTRLSLNGQYIGTPLPYAVVLRIVPSLQFFRSLSRWTFLVSLALSLLAGCGISYVIGIIPKKLAALSLILFLCGYASEVFPLTYATYAVSQNPSISSLQSTCAKHAKILLEYPVFSYTNAELGFYDPSSASLQMLESTYHHCPLINGYSGIIPSSLHTLSGQLAKALLDENKEDFFALLQNAEVDLLRIHRSSIDEKSWNTLKSWLEQKETVQSLYSDEQTALYEFQ